MVENELGFAFMAVNLRKYTAMNTNPTIDDENKSNLFLDILASYAPTSFFRSIQLYPFALYKTTI
ncbi:hypothetical protein J2Z81_003169 [Virgibacillus campisalis]|uniref:Transposase n=1 Tax=Virgibacillus alimentarius TaxID=698769 RepID=A0ABS4SDV2_9BACI|nr:hypothetical protein [Virgibacillus alimentarius]